MREVKFISLAEFKAITEGAGGFEGYISKWGELDDGADIVAKNAHADTLAQFLKRGFNTDSHDWSFGTGLVGYPVSAIEDEVGTLISARFHSDQKSQDVHTKVLERRAAGLDVFLSIGYEPSAPPIIIYPKDYATEIPKYSKPEFVEANLAKAGRFPKVRILVKNHLYEGALVTVPMLGSAGVLSAKSAPEPATKDTPTPNVKGMFEEELAARNVNLYAYFDVLLTVIQRLTFLAIDTAGTGLTFDLPAMLDEALAEYTDRVRAYVLADIASYGDGEMDFTSGEETAAAVKRALADGTTFAAHLEAVVDAVSGLTERAKRRADTRTKEGRTISAATADKLRALRERMDEMGPIIDALLEAAEPKDKDEEKAAIAEAAALIREHYDRQARIRELRRS